MSGQLISLERYGIRVQARRNAPVAALYETALRYEPGSQITSAGALVALSGEKTGRSPSDKRIVFEPESESNIWWGPVNIRIDPHTFETNRERAEDYLNTRERLFVVDGFAGWEEGQRIKVRVICARAYHALFMHNMLIRPTSQELETFGEPDFVIINAGAFPANRHTAHMSSKTSVDLSLSARQLVILGTEYAGEMKKGVFTYMNYLMPLKNVLPMHCSATEAVDGSDSSILFGLSGTGKTTLSADPNRRLVGDDEHCWSDEGIFNIEGGCYAKTADLSRDKEPEIYDALRFGSVLENVVVDPETRGVDFSNTSITKNTRGSYPLDFISSAKVPCVTQHPKNVIFLTCDAFGVLPPVSKLSSAQAMYHFVSGYTAKVAGTEMGVFDPEATFSPCFGGPFLVWHPAKYAKLLADRIARHGAATWLVNTGWSGGGFGSGARISLKHTRAIIDAIHSGRLSGEVERDPVFGLDIPVACPGVPRRILNPRGNWAEPKRYDQQAAKLSSLFMKNFDSYSQGLDLEVTCAGPRARGSEVA